MQCADFVVAKCLKTCLARTLTTNILALTRRLLVTQLTGKKQIVLEVE